jgi:hypothetical protein
LWRRYGKREWAENTALKARLERLERLIKERPYLTASTEPVPSKAEGPVQ